MVPKAISCAVWASIFLHVLPHRAFYMIVRLLDILGYNLNSYHFKAFICMLKYKICCLFANYSLISVNVLLF